MKKFLLIIIAISLFGCKSHMYLLTDKKHYEKYTEDNDKIDWVEKHIENFSKKYDSEVLSSIQLLIKSDQPEKMFFGVDPPPCIPVPPDFISIKEYKNHDLPPFPPCPLPTMPRPNLLKEKLYFLPTLKIESVNLYNEDLEMLGSPSFKIIKDGKFNYLVMDESLIKGTDKPILELGSDNKYYHLYLSK